MKRKTKQGIVWLEFEILQCFPEVKHGVFLNLELGEASGCENPKYALDLFGIRQGVKLGQCHQSNIKSVSRETFFLSHFDGYDGMVTSEKEVGLLIRHADCQAAIFYDPVHQALGNIHCGWRGSVQNIYQKTVDTMKNLYNTNPTDLIVCIGPSLGPEAAEFKHYKEEFPKSFWKYQPCRNYFDFWEISRMQLIEAGVPKAQIETAGICTYHEAECFSYRSNKKTPHHGTLACMLESIP